MGSLAWIGCFFFITFDILTAISTRVELQVSQATAFEQPGCGGVGRWPVFFAATNGTNVAIELAESSLSGMTYTDAFVLAPFTACVRGKLEELGPAGHELASRVERLPFIDLHRALGALALYTCNPTRNAFMDRAVEYAARGGLRTVPEPSPALRQRPGRPRVFQIGYNKCATRSIWALARSLGLEAAHNNVPAATITTRDKAHSKGVVWIAAQAQKNVMEGRAFLAGLERYDYFGDAGMALCEPKTGAMRLNDVRAAFSFLEAQHPGSLFILNVRDVPGWVRSRQLHTWGRHPTCLGPFSDANPWAPAAWELDLRLFYAFVLDYFACRPCQLAVVNIAAPDDWAALCRFVAGDPGAVCGPVEHVGLNGARRRRRLRRDRRRRLEQRPLPQREPRQEPLGQ